jgi:hypothetical protein
MALELDWLQIFNTMKLNKIFFFIGITSLLMACKETPPYINLTPSNVNADTTYIVQQIPAAQASSVLIEDFTGVRCPNCPNAQTEATNLMNNNPGRVHVVTIHPLNLLNSLTTPFSIPIRGDKVSNKYDFRTQAGKEIFSLIGITNALPRGAVNRKLFSGETERAIDYQKWAAYVNAELTKNTPLNIDLNCFYTPQDSIAIELTLTYTEALSDSNYLTVAIIENDLKDVQERQTGVTTVYDTAYIHEHVLRAVVTDFYGDLLKATLVRGRVFKKTLLYKRDPNWNKNHLKIIAFVHGNTTIKNVIHSKEAEIQ